MDADKIRIVLANKFLKLLQVIFGPFHKSVCIPSDLEEEFKTIFDGEWLRGAMVPDLLKQTAITYPSKIPRNFPFKAQKMPMEQQI